MIRLFTSLLFALLFSTVVAVALQWGAEARAQGSSPGTLTAGPPESPGGGGTGHCPTQSCPHPGNPCVSGVWCTAPSCTASNGAHGGCTSDTDSEANELWWWCPGNTWTTCYCQDGCAPLGIAGLCGLARRLSLALSSLAPAATE